MATDAELLASLERVKRGVDMLAVERDRYRKALQTIARADDPQEQRRWTMVGLATVARVALGRKA